MLKISTALLLTCISVLACADDAPPILVLTGAGATNNLTTPDSQPYGPVFTDKMLRDAGKRYVSESLPFARALGMLAQQANAILYPLARTPERELQYRWIGVVAERTYYFYRLSSRKDIAVKSLNDARRYRIGVLRKDARAEYLRAQGFVDGESAGLQEVSYGMSNFKNLLNGRIDLAVYSPEGLKRACAEEAVDCDQFTRLFKLDLSGSLWLVASPLMPPMQFAELKKAHRRQVNSGYLPTLMKSGRPAGY